VELLQMSRVAALPSLHWEFWVHAGVHGVKPHDAAHVLGFEHVARVYGLESSGHPESAVQAGVQGL
jgi:hypothetical protein